MATPRIAAALDAWAIWRLHQVMPAAGGWLDQPAWFMAAFDVLDRATAILDEIWPPKGRT
jgi:hypothetical protein